MKISRIKKDNVNHFVVEMDLYDPTNFINNCELVEYYQIGNDDKIYLGFIVYVEKDDKNIAIVFSREDITKNDLLSCIKELKNSIYSDNRLYLTIYDEKFINILENELNTIEINNEIGFRVFDITK